MEDDFVYCPYIVKNGKVIYPKKAKVFKIPIYRTKKKTRVVNEPSLNK